MKSELPIPVVVPVFGREDVFETVAKLRSQEYAAQMRFVVIDNGNETGLSARLASLAGEDCHVVRFEENRGGSAAYIAGMDFARKNFPESPYVWLLDDDAKPNVDTLPALVETMDKLVAEDPRTASVGSTVVSAKDPDRIVECGASFSPLLGHAFPKLGGCSLLSVGQQVVRVDYAAACSLLVNVSAVEACGFWEDVFIHFDDIEWGLRHDHLDGRPSRVRSGEGRTVGLLLRQPEHAVAGLQIRVAPRRRRTAQGQTQEPPRAHHRPPP